MQNISRIVEFHARKTPNSEALIYDNQRLSWQELWERVTATAAGLAARGIGADSVVALAMKNSAAFIELLYAISHLGAVSLPINFRLSAEELAYIADHANAKLIIADEELASLTTETEIEILLLDSDAQRNSAIPLGYAGNHVVCYRRSGSDLYRLMYTSGTTDRPKGVMHSYDNFYWKSFDHIVALGLSAADRLCIAGPLYHVGACDLPGLGVHLAGGTIVLLREFDADNVMSTIEAEQINGIWLAPIMTNDILALKNIACFNSSSLRWCVGGGERTPESRIRKFIAVFPNARYIDAYGMTETVSGDTFMEPGFEIKKIGSVGRPTPMLELEIRDDEGSALPAGEEGEICMRGPKVTAGYWKDPVRTTDATWPDGFFRTGDVGLLDGDGFLFLTDRKKDMIISGGENISSSEVERVIYEMPQVKEVAVIGRPDDRWGETPVAFIVPNETTSLTFDELLSFCRQRLAGFKCPKELIVMEELPRNPSGKVLKRVLRDLME
jgi:fatty-acyl-CoA synthase